MHARIIRISVILALSWTLSALWPQHDAAAMPGAHLGTAAEAGIGSLRHDVDIFRDCAKVRSCWRTRSGRRACGLVERCRVCKFVRRCRKGRGCFWEESCRWGPRQAPIPQ